MEDGGSIEGRRADARSVRKTPGVARDGRKRPTGLKDSHMKRVKSM